MKTYSIGEVAAMTGLPAKTIRFYEEEGILSPVSRQDNGYRSYPPEVVEELKLLKYARDLGLPLSEIKKLMKGCESGDCEHSGTYIKSSIENYLSLLNRQITQMTFLKSRLEQLKKSLPTAKNCRDGVFCCELLHQLVNYARRKGGEI